MIVIDGYQISSIIRSMWLSRISLLFSQKLGRLVHVNLIVKFLVVPFMTIWRFYYTGICSQIKADVYCESINFPSARSSNRRRGWWVRRDESEDIVQSIHLLLSHIVVWTSFFFQSWLRKRMCVNRTVSGPSVRTSTTIWSFVMLQLTDYDLSFVL